MAISQRELQLADILITTSDHAVSHCGLVAGNIEFGPVHNRTERPGKVCHATTGGILYQDAAKWLQDRGSTEVFRMAHLPEGVGAKISEIALKLQARCKYGVGRAWVKSWTGTSDFGVNAKARVYKYLARLGMGGGTFITDVYCSELVILSYQLAANGNESAPSFINLDGKHSLPKDLRAWLLNHAKGDGKWVTKGVLT